MRNQIRTSLFLAFLSFLEDGESNTVTLGEGDDGLFSLADDKDVLDSSGESVSARVLEGNDVVSTINLGNVGNDSDTASVVSFRDVGNVAKFEGKHISDLFLLEVELHGVVHLDSGVGKTDGASISSNEVSDLVGTHLFALNTAQNEVGLSLLNLNESEASLHIVEATPGGSHLRHIDDVHETDGVLEVTTDVLVDVDESLLLVKDHLRFISIEGDLDFVAEEELNRDALAQLVGPGGGSHGEVAAHLVHQPAFRSSHAFQMFFRSSCLISLPFA